MVVITEQVGSSGNTSDLYSEGTWFKSRPGHSPILTDSSWLSSVPASKCQGSIPKLGHCRFHPCPLKFIIHCYAVIWRYTECPRNKCCKLERECCGPKQWKQFIETWDRNELVECVPGDSMISRTSVTKVTFAKDTWRKQELRVEDVSANLSFITTTFHIQQQNTQSSCLEWHWVDHIH
jgi:hypothetical protein